MVDDGGSGGAGDTGPADRTPPRRRTSPDPLGKRALFWVPPQAPPPRPGRAPLASTRPAGRSGGRRATAAGAGGAVPLGKHALYSGAVASPGSTPPADPENPVADQGPVTVECGRCGAVRRIGLLDLLIYQLPVGLWLPRRRFDHRMTCPACKKRAWMSVTLRRR